MNLSRAGNNDQTSQLHELITIGSVDNLKLALAQNPLIDAPGHCGNTALMVAISTGDIEKVRLIVEQGADLELTDDFNHTALHHAVEWDFQAAVELLLTRGVDRGYHPKYPLKQVEREFKLPKVPLPDELKQVMSEAEWDKQQEETSELILELLKNPKAEPVIANVRGVDVLKLLIAAGDDVNLAPVEVKREWVGLKNDVELKCSKSEYLKHKSPSYGRTNPELMDFPFWNDMVRTGGHAYSARKHFEDESAFSLPGAVWSFDRFGSSLVRLSDGRFVQIGGEHEDYYDPDFFIYNDVVVHDGQGSFHIYGYPRDVFPPTDFHTATLCQDVIYIIGNLGYMDERRAGYTPVYRLTLDSWKIEAIVTSGEMPGWIHNHHARYDHERNVITLTGGIIHMILDDETTDLVPNSADYELNVNDLCWVRR